MSWEETLKAFQCQHRDLPESVQLGILPLKCKELILNIWWLNNRGIRSRRCTSINSLFPIPSTIQCWKTRFKTEVCSCSGYPSEAMHWIKEVELVDSVDDLKSSQSSRGHQFPNFEMLDGKIASSLKKISQNSNLKKRIHLAEQEAQLDDRLLRGRQIAFVICEYFQGDRRSRGCA